MNPQVLRVKRYVVKVPKSAGAGLKMFLKPVQVLKTSLCRTVLFKNSVGARHVLEIGTSSLYHVL